MNYPLEGRVLPKDVRFVAGIVERVTRYNRRRLLKVYCSSNTTRKWARVLQ